MSIIAGPLAAGLAGAGAGALTGGLVGALVGWGIPEEHAKRYEVGIKSGGIVMGVRPHSDEDADYLEGEWASSGKDMYRGVKERQRGKFFRRTGCALPHFRTNRRRE